MVPWFNSAFDSYQCGFRSLTRSVWCKALAAGMFDEYGSPQCCGYAKQSVSKSHSGLHRSLTTHIFMSTCTTLSGLILLPAITSSSHFQKHQPWCHQSRLMITNKTWNALADLGLNNWFPSPIWEILDPSLITLHSKGTQIVYIEPPSHIELFCSKCMCLDEDYNELI